MFCAAELGGTHQSVMTPMKKPRPSQLNRVVRTSILGASSSKLNSNTDPGTMEDVLFGKRNIIWGTSERAKLIEECLGNQYSDVRASRDSRSIVRC